MASGHLPNDAVASGSGAGEGMTSMDAKVVLAVAGVLLGAACSTSHNLDQTTGTGGSSAPPGTTIGKGTTTGGAGIGISGIATGSAPRGAGTTPGAPGSTPGSSTPAGGSAMVIPGSPVASTPCTSVAQCGGAVPQCGATQRCQGCRTNSDCAGFGGLVCDVASGSCVECATAMDCQNGRICSALSHSCERGCATNADCTRGGNTICAQGACVECMTDAECQGQHCDAGSCVACLKASDCGGGSMCLAGDCVRMGCTSNAQCMMTNGEGGGLCATSIRACVECFSNADCGNQGYCQPDYTCGGGQ